MAKTIKEINEKIKSGNVVVVTAEEMIDIVAVRGARKASEHVDIVTTATFGPMCSSAAYLNIGHSKPRIKLGGGKVTINDVPVYAGFAAVDIMIGATAIPDSDPRNAACPGEFSYGGGHVIQDLVAGRDVTLKAESYGTDCYPRKALNTALNIKDMNEAVLFNPRNAYQNYNCAVNLSQKTIYTYMGTLLPNIGNANYCSAGQLSPLMNDPYYRTIGIGTRIFLGGGEGYVAWHGTQHNPSVKRKPNGIPIAPAGTLAVIGDMKTMNPEFLVGASFKGYGATLIVGIGVPIPVLDEEMAVFTSVRDEDICTQIVDYSEDYGRLVSRSLGEVNYKQLRSGTVEIQGKSVKTGSLSSLEKARRIADILKKKIQKKQFYLTEPSANIPGSADNYTCHLLKERPVRP